VFGSAFRPSARERESFELFRSLFLCRLGRGRRGALAGTGLADDGSRLAVRPAAAPMVEAESRPQPLSTRARLRFRAAASS
jgi:hypothetical protein